MRQQRVAVAVSGGRDSMALLHCTAHAAAACAVEVIGLHVHHGLHRDADAWLEDVREHCGRWSCAFAAHRVDGAPAHGASVEAWARAERYRALARMALDAGCSLVLLAHHRRDQAETWLLQALRGGGPAGLAAMPRTARRAGLTWVRPWLGMSRQAIDAYVEHHRLRPVDDDSNADPRLARGRLRVQVWPHLVHAFADVEAAFSSAAQRAKEAAALADEIALIDLPAVISDDVLVVACWLKLTPARRRNVTRAWLTSCGLGAAPQTLVDRLLGEVPGRDAARWPAPGAEVRLYRGVLTVALSPRVPTVDGAMAAPKPVDLSHLGEHRLPGWPGCIRIARATGPGVPAAALRSVVARQRQGGERFVLNPGAAARSLKKQFQVLGIPAWSRSGPLLHAADGQLIFVPGLGTSAAMRTATGPEGLCIDWLPDLPLPPGPKTPPA